mmetsp:Transcript_32506/g.52657  ORF Transcript_32506/g.52657 Transcript_32506/m.52657 type:complete len:265 (-) Transcript_32506:303-1097(-)
MPDSDNSTSRSASPAPTSFVEAFAAFADPQSVVPTNSKGFPIPTLKVNTILVNKRQRGNPILSYISNVSLEYIEIVPDYLLGAYTCALYISLKYHRLHPEYLYGRIKALHRNYRVRIILCEVDVEDNDKPIQDIAKTALLQDCTLILAWSPQEAARYLETYRAYENKGPEAIQERVDGDYLAKLQDALSVIRSVNKTDVMTLAQTFGSLKAIMNASMDELSLCPGLGEKKVRRIYEAFHESLQPKKRGARKAPEQPSTSLVSTS